MHELQLAVSLQRGEFSFAVQTTLALDGVTVIYGPSGSGKTTLLRCLAGLEPQAKGSMVLHRAGAAPSAGTTSAPVVWQDSARGVFVAAHQRSVGYVFQEASLFDHLTVQGNLDYALQRRRVRAQQHAPAEIDVKQVIELLGIGHLLQRTANSLSGGERQRVAIARALAASPRLLLMDEPLAALDDGKKQEIMPWLEKLRRELTLPIIYVTHAMQEVMALGDHLLVMFNGRLQMQGALMDVMASAPWMRESAERACCLLQGQVQAIDVQWHLAKIDCAGVGLWVRHQSLRMGQTVRVLVNAQDVSLTLHEPQATSIQNHFEVVIESVQADDHPSQVLVHLRAASQDASQRLVARITARSAYEMSLAPGGRVWAQVKTVSLVR
jgi:molybdate transport system ATP-binding protein